MEWIILGISPTTDKKAIKSAYAKLAKKYNPEEYPEQFRRIHDAYRLAMSFADSRGDHGVPRGIPRSFDVSGDLDTDDELDFSGVSGDKNSGHAENGSHIDNEETFDFSKLGKSPANEEKNADEPKNDDDFIFPDFDKPDKKSTGHINRAGSKKKSDSKKNHDFFDPDDFADSSDEEKFAAVLTAIASLVSDPKKRSRIDLWQVIFDSDMFTELSANNTFRRMSNEIIYGKMLRKDTARIIADAFGYGSSIIHVHYKPVHEYTVKITQREIQKLFPSKDDLRKFDFFDHYSDTFYDSILDREITPDDIKNLVKKLRSFTERFKFFPK